MKNKLIVKNLEVVYENLGTRLKAVKDLNFEVNDNEFVCILGSSGCGKTSILNAIAGFIKPTKGEILLNGINITEPTKNIGIVFQHNALFPWKTVEGNIKLGSKINGIQKYKIKKITEYYLQLIGLKKYANFYPNELSGGQQQRVGFARALANDPEIILMDEPFSHLDAQTRAKLHQNLLQILNKHKKTIVFVTHDIDEALILSDRILIMSRRPGKIKAEIKNILPKPRTYQLTTEIHYQKQKKKIINFIA